MRESWKVSVLVLFVLASGCLNKKFCKGASGLLPPLAVADLKEFKEPADIEPGEPVMLYRPLGRGAWARTIFTADSGKGYRVEVWDLHVGSKQEAAEIELPGPAVVEILSGSARLTGVERQRELPPGATFTLAAGERFGLANAGEIPITLRVHVVVPDRP